MKLLQKEAMTVSLFIFLATADLLLRFFFLERGHWTCNEGVFWGIYLPFPLIFFLAIALLLCIAHFFFRVTREKRLFLLMLLIGGGMNAFDRLVHGCVLDYFTWPGFLSSYFPHFNLADMFLLTGVLGVLWHRGRNTRWLFKGEET